MKTIYLSDCSVGLLPGWILKTHPVADQRIVADESAMTVYVPEGWSVHWEPNC